MDQQIGGEQRLPQVPTAPVSNQERFKTDQEVHDMILAKLQASGNQWDGDPDQPQQPQDDIGGGQPNAQVEGDEQKAPEPEQKAEDVIELDPEAELFELELDVDGKKEAKRLSLSELQKGYLRQQDYTRKTQEVARARAEAEAAVQQQIQQAQQAYQQQLMVVRQALIAQAAPELQNVDWNKLANEDPAEFVRLSAKAQQVQTSLQAVDAEMRQHAQQRQQHMQQALAQVVQESVQVLRNDIPEWSDTKYRDLMKAGIDEYGFTQEEIGNVYDARVIKMLHDAAQWRQLQKAKPAVEKKLVTVPKVLKPGTQNQQVNPAQKGLQEANTRLRKSGKPDDFAALLLAKGSHRL